MQSRSIPNAYALAKQIGEHLVGWRAEEGRDYEGTPMPDWASLTRDGDGARLGIVVASNRRRTRVTVRTRWPRFRDGSTALRWPILEFTCSTSRSAPAIARAIERRLLGKYDVFYPLAVDEVRESDTATVEAWVVAKRVARTIGAEPPPKDDPRWRPNDSPVRIYGGPAGVQEIKVVPRRRDENARVHFEVSLDEEAAVRVLNMIDALERFDTRPSTVLADVGHEGSDSKLQCRAARGEGDGHVCNQVHVHR